MEKRCGEMFSGVFKQITFNAQNIYISHIQFQYLENEHSFLYFCGHVISAYVDTGRNAA